MTSRQHQEEKNSNDDGTDGTNCTDEKKRAQANDSPSSPSSSSEGNMKDAEHTVATTSIVAEGNERDGKNRGDQHSPPGTQATTTAAAAADEPVTTTTTTTTATNKKNKIPSRKTKKRSRKEMDHVSVLDRQLAVKQDRYDKLLYIAKKQLTKQAKQVRAFMVQRNIRKLKNSQPPKTKQANGDNDDDVEKEDQGNDDDVEDKLLQPLKDLPLDLVVQQAVRQLGLTHANPNPDATFAPVAALPAEQSKLISSILDHKRFQSALEEWNEKVAEFRRFCLMMDDSNNKFAPSSHDALPLTKRGKNKGKRGSAPTTSLRPQQQQQEHQPTSYFCTSLNQNAAAGDEGEAFHDEAENKMAAYGPAATMMMDGGDMLKPKNRQGQRARKAKALAIQAKKEGRQYQSLNWREEGTSSSKKKPTKDDASKPSKSSSSKSSNGAGAGRAPEASRGSDGAKPKEDLASHHPSWAAKQQQKSGIVAFQGKKITFD